MQRTWLWGEATGRPALLLDFAPPGAPLEPRPAPGLASRARGLPSGRDAVARLGGLGAAGAAPGASAGGTEAALRSVADAVALNPWLDEWPVALAAAVVDGREDGPWTVSTEDGSLPLGGSREARWRALAFSGGRPISLFGCGTVRCWSRWPRATASGRWRCEGDALRSGARGWRTRAGSRAPGCGRGRSPTAGSCRTRCWMRWTSTSGARCGASGSRRRLHVRRRGPRDRRLLPCRPAVAVASLYVLPERRHGGVGAALLSAALDELRPHSAHATLWVFTDNHPARAFYARFGFTPRDGRRGQGDPAAGGAVTRGIRDWPGGGAVSWDDLVAAALIGTDRRPVEAAVPEGRRPGWRVARRARRRGAAAGRGRGVDRRAAGGGGRRAAGGAGFARGGRRAAAGARDAAADDARGHLPVAAAGVARARSRRAGCGRRRSSSRRCSTTRRGTPSLHAAVGAAAGPLGRWLAERAPRWAFVLAGVTTRSGRTASRPRAARCSTGCAAATRRRRARAARLDVRRRDLGGPRGVRRGARRRPLGRGRATAGDRARRPPQARPRRGRRVARPAPALALRRPHGGAHSAAAARGGRRARRDAPRLPGRGRGAGRRAHGRPPLRAPALDARGRAAVRLDLERGRPPRPPRA